MPLNWLVRALLDVALHPLETEKQWKARQLREASRRWSEHNAEAKARGCRCGKPATRVTVDSSNAGWVPVENWTCAEHQGVTMWRRGPAGLEPLWERKSPCGSCAPRRCGGRGGPIGGPTTQWFCPSRPETTP